MGRRGVKRKYKWMKLSTFRSALSNPGARMRFLAGSLVTKVYNFITTDISWRRGITSRNKRIRMIKTVRLKKKKNHVIEPVLRHTLCSTKNEVSATKVVFNKYVSIYWNIKTKYCYMESAKLLCVIDRNIYNVLFSKIRTCLKIFIEITKTAARITHKYRKIGSYLKETTFRNDAVRAISVCSTLAFHER